MTLIHRRWATVLQRCLFFFLTLTFEPWSWFFPMITPRGFLGANLNQLSKASFCCLRLGFCTVEAGQASPEKKEKEIGGFSSTLINPHSSRSTRLEGAIWHCKKSKISNILNLNFKISLFLFKISQEKIFWNKKKTIILFKVQRKCLSISAPPHQKCPQKRALSIARHHRRWKSLIDEGVWVPAWTKTSPNDNCTLFKEQGGRERA